MARTEIETMQQVIKDYVQRSGETYQSLGQKLGLSIATAKRMLNGEDLSMERALEICDALGVTFSDFLADVSALSVRYRFYTEAQEAFLTRRFHHFAFLRFLQKGWTTEQIGTTFSLDATDTARYLADLEREGFLVMMPSGDLRLLSRDGMDWLPNGELWQVHMRGWVESVVDSFFAKPLADDNGFVDITQRTLSAESFRALQGELDELSRKYKSISAVETRAAKKGQKLKTFHSLFMLSEWSTDFWRVGPYQNDAVSVPRRLLAEKNPRRQR